MCVVPYKSCNVSDWKLWPRLCQIYDYLDDSRRRCVVHHYSTCYMINLSDPFQRCSLSLQSLFQNSRPLSLISPLNFKDVLLLFASYVIFRFGGTAPTATPSLATRLRSDKHISIPCPTPEAHGFKAINYGQISIQGPALVPLVGSRRWRRPRKLRGFSRSIKVRWAYFVLYLIILWHWQDTIWRGVQGAEPPPPQNQGF